MPSRPAASTSGWWWCTAAASTGRTSGAGGPSCSPRRGHDRAVVWSPFSNLWLYGITLDVPMVQRERRCAWAPTGARRGRRTCWASSRWLGSTPTPRAGSSTTALVRMVTANPGDALARAWQTPSGRLVPGALGDLVAVTQRRDDAWKSLVAARERDVVLVAVAGRPRLGTAEAMLAAGAAGGAGAHGQRHAGSRWSGPTTRRSRGPGPRCWRGWTRCASRPRKCRRRARPRPGAGARRG